MKSYEKSIVKESRFVVLCAETDVETLLGQWLPLATDLRKGLQMGLKKLICDGVN